MRERVLVQELSVVREPELVRVPVPGEGYLQSGCVGRSEPVQVQVGGVLVGSCRFLSIWS